MEKLKEEDLKGRIANLELICSKLLEQIEILTGIVKRRMT